MPNFYELKKRFDALPKNIGDLSYDDLNRNLETAFEIYEEAMKEKAVLDAEIERRKALK